MTTSICFGHGPAGPRPGPRDHYTWERVGQQWRQVVSRLLGLSAKESFA